MRFHKRYIWQRFFSFLPGVIVFLYALVNFTMETTDEGPTTYSGFLGIDSSGKFLIAAGIILLVYSLFCILYSYLYWKKTTYEISETEITLQKGVLFKKNIVIEFRNIHAVNVDRRFLSIILGLSSLCIDSGNARTSSTNEIEIFDLPVVVKKMEEELNDRINAIKKERRPSEEVKKEEVVKKLKYELNGKCQRKLSLFSLPFVAFLLFITVSMVFALIGNHFLDESERIGFIYIIIFYFVIVVFTYLLIRLAFKILYHKFRITYNDKDIIIEYGLLHQRRFIISKEKVKGLVFRQDVVQKVAKFGSLEIHMVGLQEASNDNNNSFIKLFPYVEVSELNDLLSELGLKEQFKETKSTCSKSSYVYFIALPIIISFIILTPFIVSFLFLEYIVSIVLLAVFVFVVANILIFSLIRKKNQSIDFNNDYIYVSNGVLVKSNYAIPWKSVVSMGTKGTYFREKNNITSIVIDYYSDKVKTKQTIAMQDIKTYGEVLLYFESIKNK